MSKIFGSSVDPETQKGSFELERVIEREGMKEVFGSPGKVSGLALRIGQCSFAAASIGVMYPYKVIQIISSWWRIGLPLPEGFNKFLDKFYLIASMGLQVLWSLGLACLDLHALRSKRSLQNPVLVSLFVVGDWVTAILSLAAACSSAGVTVLYSRDLNYCGPPAHLPCSRFQIAVAFAFISWFLLAVSSIVMFWLLGAV
ncbi:unnamed protein product [Prunus armeniaca]|uniref:CASP-like protein n=1 Tax=Prunus armeniaca TaxID=36596 RepID=A0A6J5U379_PRUAR|nr:unnamed protein product [Prunus armeniaca]